jgi:acetyltransferase-like isoleucine patch superfamily enzyme
MTTVRVYESARIIGRENIEFGNHVIIDDFVFIHAKKRIRIGNYVHIGAYSSLSGGEEITLADFSGLSFGCRILTATDDFTGAGFGNPTIPEQFRNVKRAPVHLGRFAILGTNCVVLPGLTLGEGVSVGANSVVTKNLEPWGVYIGNRRVAERDRDGVLANYHRFLKDSA